jgi:hypothetical protein
MRLGWEEDRGVLKRRCHLDEVENIYTYICFTRPEILHQLNQHYVIANTAVLVQPSNSTVW